MWININLQFLTVSGCFLTAGLLFWQRTTTPNIYAVSCSCNGTGENQGVLVGTAPSTSNVKIDTSTARQLLVMREQRVVQLVEYGRVVAEYPVAVGKPGWETPPGTFQVEQMQQNPAWQHPITGMVVPAGRDNPMGTRWIGFLSTSSGMVGFHGTNNAESVGQASSHGCLRLKNHHIEALFPKVTIGTTVIVR